VAGARILVVEDDESIGRSLCRALEAEGHAVEWARTGAEVVDNASSTTELVLLDLGLPDVDGLDICRELRTRFPDIQILVLTARREEVDVVLGLDAGADDYLVKPFRLAELMARTRARLRNRQVGEGEMLTVGSLSIDVAARRASRDGEELDLRPREFDLLKALACEAGRVVRRERLMQDVWDEHWFGSTKTLDIHVCALRRKLDGDSATSCITTLRGVGYRLEAL